MFDAPGHATEQAIVTVHTVTTQRSGDTRARDHADLGVMTFGALDELVTTAKGKRVAYDAWEVPLGDGAVRRYQAVNVADAQRAVA